MKNIGKEYVKYSSLYLTDSNFSEEISSEVGMLALGTRQSETVTDYGVEEIVMNHCAL